jgi:uncharacterized protein
VTGENRLAAARQEVELGADALRAAAALLDLGLPNDAVSRAYYAAFHHARALLVLAGLEPKTHRGVVSMLERECASGSLPIAEVTLLARLQTFRGLADYDAASRMSMDRATSEVAAAREFVDRLAALLHERGV